MDSVPSDLTISPAVLRNWQRIVDLMANIMHVPSAVVTKIDPLDFAHYSVIVSSDTKGNPFPIDESFSMEIGTFCETVIKNRKPLLVINALEDSKFKSAPEIRVGMISYLGLPVFWPDGRIFGTICVLDDKANQYTGIYQELMSHFRDVLQGDLQALTRLGHELEEQKSYFSELFARVPEGIVMVDRSSTITRVNPEFTKIFGFTADEAIGQRIQDLIIPDDLQEQVEDFLQRMLVDKEVFALETVRKNKNGICFPVSVICVPVASSHHENSGYVIYRDLTESKRHQEEQRRIHDLQLELAHSQRIATIGQLSASIAHELNQPLTGIISNCDVCLRMLTSSPPSLEGARDALLRTMRDGNRASDVIARLRALFNQTEPAFEQINLNEAAQEVIALSLNGRLNDQVTVRTELDADLPFVTADRVQLQQVILNLLRNALDAMIAIHDRPRELVIKTESEIGERVRLSVTDTGIGFDPQIKDKLFLAFFSTKPDGMGVGLSVSRSIIENYSGRLWATLNDGPGATFSFSLPCQTSTNTL